MAPDFDAHLAAVNWPKRLLARVSRYLSDALSLFRKERHCSSHGYRQLGVDGDQVRIWFLERFGHSISELQLQASPVFLDRPAS